mmetsp:Transcript_26097/g.83298  ORF Transcript_26097/g.83298 Transcript_26097/m.83298 type:complete len:223 (-) Transcript_26097:273-941(-)
MSLGVRPASCSSARHVCSTMSRAWRILTSAARGTTRTCAGLSTPMTRTPSSAPSRTRPATPSSSRCQRMESVWSRPLEMRSQGSASPLATRRRSSTAWTADQHPARCGRTGSSRCSTRARTKSSQTPWRPGCGRATWCASPRRALRTSWSARAWPRKSWDLRAPTSTPPSSSPSESSSTPGRARPGGRRRLPRGRSVTWPQPGCSARRTRGSFSRIRTTSTT